jgi:hypothetical protein
VGCWRARSGKLRHHLQRGIAQHNLCYSNANSGAWDTLCYAHVYPYPHRDQHSYTDRYRLSLEHPDEHGNGYAHKHADDNAIEHTSHFSHCYANRCVHSDTDSYRNPDLHPY